MNRFVVWSGMALLMSALCLPTNVWGQSKAGTLQVTATLQGSINLVFVNNANVGQVGFCPLTNASTNNAGLDLGTARATTGDTNPCVAFAFNVGAGQYQVSSAFDVSVSKANTVSGSYRLAVAISTVAPANVTWLMNAVTMTTTPQTLQLANAYGRTTETLNVRVKNSVPAQALAEVIFFTATAN